MLLAVDARQTIASLLRRNGVGAEIGVFRGAFSKAIFRRAAPRKLFLVDPWLNSDAPEHAESWYATSRTDMETVHASVIKTFAAEPYAGRVEVVRSLSAEWLRAQPDDALDYVYIDGDHSYAAVKLDLELSFAKVRSGGLICADDYRLGMWWGDGVVRAVHEFLAARPVSLVLCLEGQVAIRKL